MRRSAFHDDMQKQNKPLLYRIRFLIAVWILLNGMDAENMNRKSQLRQEVHPFILQHFKHIHNLNIKFIPSHTALDSTAKSWDNSGEIDESNSSEA